MTETHERLRRFWDADAATYDDTPSHSASDPVEAACWRAAMTRFLPAAPARVLDAGAGTGSMSLLAAELGYSVTALDLSEGMLARLTDKAAAQGHDVTIVAGPADQPPSGPFDAVMARHLIWTLPDPVKTLAAWRAVAGRLLLFEGEWGDKTAGDRARSAAAKIAKRALNLGSDHHRRYEPELTQALPLSTGIDASDVLGACEEAGWRKLRIERLRDVEWVRSRARHPALRPFEGVPQFAVTGET